MPEPEVSEAPVAEFISTATFDDRDQLQADQRLLLVIEDDAKFAKVMVDLAHEHQFSCIVAEDGKTGLAFVKQYQPDAIVLDLGLPKMDGVSVMEALKDDIETRHIPVHFISANDETEQLRKMGAIGYIMKPVSMGELTQVFNKIESFIDKTIKNVVIFTDIDAHGTEIKELIDTGNAELDILDSQERVLQKLAEIDCDTLIIDAEANTGQSIKLLYQLIPSHPHIPIIIYANRELNEEEETVITECQGQAWSLKPCVPPHVYWTKPLYFCIP